MKKNYLFISVCAISLTSMAQTNVNQVMPVPTKTTVNKTFSHKEQYKVIGLATLIITPIFMVQHPTV